MKLTDLNPRWVAPWGFDATSTYHIGVSFESPLTRNRLAVLFEPPIDPAGLQQKYGWPEMHKESRKWARTGVTLETLTLSPSLDFSAAGEWHGTITAGEVC